MFKGDYSLAAIVMFSSLLYYTGLFFQWLPDVLLLGIVRFMYCGFKILNGFRNMLPCGNWMLFPMKYCGDRHKISIYAKLYFLILMFSWLCRLTSPLPCTSEQLCLPVVQLLPLSSSTRGMATRLWLLASPPPVSL